MDYSLVLFKKENYLAAKYKLVKEVRIIQVFFLTFLTVHQEDINRNYDAGSLGPQVCLASFEADGIDRPKNGWQIYPKLQLH